MHKIYLHTVRLKHFAFLISLLLAPCFVNATQSASALIKNGAKIIVHECCINFKGCALEESYKINEYTFTCGEDSHKFSYTGLTILQSDNATYLCSDNDVCYEGSLNNTTPNSSTAAMAADQLPSPGLTTLIPSSP